MLYPSPEALTADAAARLSTLSDNTELGSGFRVAMRDLEIRGAGNLLGDEQSGHVAAVGFELYCQMLEDAAEEMREGAEERRGRGARAGAGGRRRGRLRAGRLHPLRGGQDRRPPPRRRRARARRAARPARGARGPLRAGPRAGRRTCSSCSGLGSSSARPARARSSSESGRLRASPVELDSEQAAADLREQLAEAIYEWRERTLVLPVPDERRPGSARCWRWPTGSRDSAAAEAEPGVALAPA